VEFADAIREVDVRRIAGLVGVCLGTLAVLAAPAQATYHLNMVNEVMLASSSGDANVRFVEFVDHGGTEEQFTPVFAPYKLVIYDAAGNVLAEQTLNPNGLRAAAATGREYLVSTSAADAAFGVTGDERLTVALPRDAGQACFEGKPTPPAVSCLTWGKITKPVPINMFGTGSANGPAPPNGESDQRQPDNSVVVACPTPKAPNTAKPCATGPPTPFAGVSFSAHTINVDRHGRALVRLRCPTGTDGSCRGTLTLTAARGTARFGRARFTIASSKTGIVRVKLSSKALRSLRRKGKLHALATAVAHDALGTSRKATVRVTLRHRQARTRRTRGSSSGHESASAPSATIPDLPPTGRPGD
jgi:hypothetical protein